jgi:hypothetical protein
MAVTGLLLSGCAGATHVSSVDGGDKDAAMRVEAGPVDARRDDVSALSGKCMLVPCAECFCGPGCVSVPVCIDGSTAYVCDCDAGIDAGFSCNPVRVGTFYLPISCVDGGLPGDGGGPFPLMECQQLCGGTMFTDCFTLEGAGGVTVLSCGPPPMK